MPAVVDASLGYLALAVGSALSFSLMDVTRKILLARVRPMALLCILTLGAAPLFVFWWAAEGWSGPTSAYWVPGGSSIVLNILSNLAFLVAIRIAPLSVTIPMLSLTPVFATLMAIPLLGEVPTTRQMLGIALVVAGAFFVNLASGDSFAFGSAWRAIRREKGAMIAAGVAFAWSIAAPLDKLAMRASSSSFHGLAVHLGVGLVILGMLLAKRRGKELWLPSGTRTLALISVLASAAAIGLYLLAISNLWIGLVESLKRSIGSGAALLIGRVAFGEEVGRTRIAAVGLMTLGVILVLS